MGRGETEKNEKVIAWLNGRTTKARYMMSVCNGAFILANAGLLDGLSATTTAGHIDELAERFPKVRVVRERYVDNGRIITTAGLSAGIDGALHVIDREFGRLRAEHIARNLEYRWDPASQWTRSRYADMRMPEIELPADAHWKMLLRDGDNDHRTTSARLDIATEESNRRHASRACQPTSSGRSACNRRSVATRTCCRSDRAFPILIST